MRNYVSFQFLENMLESLMFRKKFIVNRRIDSEENRFV